jgi:uncharacterized lipoprotein YmbA
MSSVPSRRRILAAIALTAILARCQGSPPSRFYTLAARPAQDPASKVSRTILVQPVQTAKYLDRSEIVRYGSPYELTLSEFDRWGEGLGDMTTRILVEDLAQRLPHSQIYAASGSLTPSGADETLEVNVTKFEPDSAGTVVLAAHWTIHRKAGRDRLRTQQFQVLAAAANATKDAATGGAPTGSERLDPTSQVAAMSDALGQLATEIAKDLAG